MLTLRVVEPALVAITMVATEGSVLFAQNAALRWAKAAPFPEPEEELYGVSVNGKMYVIGGFGTNGKPATAMVYEYDAGADRWTKKKSMPVPVHHQAQAVFNGKIILPSMPAALHGNAVAFIGNRLHTVSGKPEGGRLARSRRQGHGSTRCARDPGGLRNELGPLSQGGFLPVGGSLQASGRRPQGLRRPCRVRKVAAGRVD